MQKVTKIISESLKTDMEMERCTGDIEGGIQKVAYSVSEAAIAMGVSRAFLYNYLGEHPEFPQLHLGTRIIIPIRSLEEFINSLCGEYV